MKYTMNKAPMGWNSYDYYDTTVNEAQVRANADFMAAHLKDAEIGRASCRERVF